MYRVRDDASAGSHLWGDDVRFPCGDAAEIAFARTLRTALLGLVALAILPACGYDARTIRTGSDVCQEPSSPSMPLALIGPDVDVRVFCAGATQVAIASVDEPGAGLTRWSFSVTGDPAFGLGPPPGPNTSPNAFVTCMATSPQIALVEFAPPADALPGSTFDAVSTVRSDDGSFAAGTVKLHGEVVAPVIRIEPTRIEFGDVAAGGHPTIPLRLTPENGENVIPMPDSPPDAKGVSAGLAAYSYGPFVVTPMAVQMGVNGITANDFVWNVTLMTDVPGDYSQTIAWRAVPTRTFVTNEPGANPPPPQDVPACDWTTTITLHGRVAVGAGGADAARADVSDGGADLVADEP
jgi:hypothetical protein